MYELCTGVDLHQKEYASLLLLPHLSHFSVFSFNDDILITIKDCGVLPTDSSCAHSFSTEALANWKEAPLYLCLDRVFADAHGVSTPQVTLRLHATSASADIPLQRLRAQDLIAWCLQGFSSSLFCPLIRFALSLAPISGDAAKRPSFREVH